jgi:long-chain acyl-CoA synthetase
MFTLADVTRTHAAQRPDKPALICDDRTLTYSELHTESCRVANALLDAGVGSQDRVGFIGKNIAEYFTLSHGAAKLNAVPVAVNWRLAPPEMAFILENAEVKVVLVEGEFLEHLDKMELPRNPLIIEVDGNGANVSYSEWIDGRSNDDPGYPTAVEHIDAIPRNPSGKILKVELSQPYWEGRDRAVN